MYRTGRSLVLIMALVLVCLTRAGVHAQSAPSDPATLYQQLTDAINRGDLPAIMAFYRDDAVLVGSSVCPQQTCTGKAAIQRHFENIVATHTVIGLTGTPQVSGTTLMLGSEVRNDTTRAAGVDRALLTVSVTFSDGLIARHVLQFDTSDVQTRTFLAFVQRLAQQPADVRTVVETYKQALMQLDGATIAGLFDDNVVINDLGVTAKGKAEAVAELRQVVAQNPHLQITFGETVYVLNTAIERFAYTSDPVQAAGVSRVWVIETLVVLNGKIVSYTAVPDLSDAETVRFVQAVAGH